MGDDEAGEDVAGARPPRFSPEKVEEALAELRERIKATNQNLKSPYKVVEAVAFGDFLLQKPRVQAAEVGIRLEPRKAKRGEIPSETACGGASVPQAATRESGEAEYFALRGVDEREDTSETFVAWCAA